MTVYEIATIGLSFLSIIVLLILDLRKANNIKESVDDKATQVSVDQLSKDLEKVSTKESVDKVLDNLKEKPSKDWLNGKIESFATQLNSNHRSAEKDFTDIKTKLSKIEEKTIKIDAVQEKYPDVMNAAGVINKAVMDIGQLINDYETKIQNMEKQHESIIAIKDNEISRLNTTLDEEREINIQLEKQLSEENEKSKEKDKTILDLTNERNKLQHNIYQLKHPHHDRDLDL